MRPSPVRYQALLLLELCTNSLVLQVLSVVKKLHSRIPEFGRAVWLTHGAQAHSVNTDKGVVSYNVYPVALAEVCLVSVSDGHLDTIAKAQVVVSRKTGDKLLDLMGGHTSGDLVLGEEYVAEAVVLVQPVLVAVLFPLLLRRLEAFEMCRPFSSSIEQISQEQGCIRVDMAL